MRRHAASVIRSCQSMPGLVPSAAISAVAGIAVELLAPRGRLDVGDPARGVAGGPSRAAPRRAADEASSAVIACVDPRRRRSSRPGRGMASGPSSPSAAARSTPAPVSTATDATPSPGGFAIGASAFARLVNVPAAFVWNRQRAARAAPSAGCPGCPRRRQAPAASRNRGTRIARQSASSRSSSGHSSRDASSRQPAVPSRSCTWRPQPALVERQLLRHRARHPARPAASMPTSMPSRAGDERDPRLHRVVGARDARRVPPREVRVDEVDVRVVLAVGIRSPGQRPHAPDRARRDRGDVRRAGQQHLRPPPTAPSTRGGVTVAVNSSFTRRRPAVGAVGRADRRCGPGQEPGVVEPSERPLRRRRRMSA